MTIVSIRGTHGSGKSTVVRKILEKYGAVEIVDSTKPKKPLGYDVLLSNKEILFVVGSYRTPCGGCDAIQPYAEIWPRIESAADSGKHVLFEGALVSSSYGNIGRSSEKYGDQMVFAFLDTPLEVCLERIQQRRLARGDSRPLDETSTTHKFNAIQKSEVKIQQEFGRKVVQLDYSKPVTQVLKLFGVTMRKEPS
jgi:thymidylate kinase